MMCPNNEPVDTGATLRTGADVRCEFATPEGSQIRMNAETEVRVSDQRQFELTKGQLWSCVREGQPPLAVKAANATITAQEAQFDLAKQNGEAVLTVVQGTATVRDKQGERTVEAGQRVTLVDGQIAEDRRALDAILDTSWVHEVLLLKGSDDPEYIDRMNRLLARIGEAKLSILYEEEIRRQGDACVSPLVSYVQSDQSREQTDKRRRAARIVADVAQPRSIPDLVNLLSDEDSFVRRSAAEGLLRLTGHDHGRPPPEWQTETWAGCQPTVKQWQDWLERQRDRIPGAPRSKDSKQIQYKKA
jgi:hypothetical protein